MTLRSLSDPAWTTTGYAGDPSGAVRDALRGRPAVPTLTGTSGARRRRFGRVLGDGRGPPTAPGSCFSAPPIRPG